MGLTTLATVLAPGQLTFAPQDEGILSVFCLGAEASGVNLRGLQYPLDNATLTASFPLGVSNHFLGKAAQVSLAAGQLLILWDRGAGLPQSRTEEGI